MYIKKPLDYSEQGRGTKANYTVEQQGTLSTMPRNGSTHGITQLTFKYLKNPRIIGTGGS